MLLAIGICLSLREWQGRRGNGRD